jgi:hypothetical protein
VGVIGAALAIRGAALLLRLGLGLGLGMLGRRAVVLRPTVGAVVHGGMLMGLGLLARRALDVDVGDAAALAAGEGLVLVGRLGVLCDDVPGVQEAGQEAEDSEADVDEGVGAADAALDPDGQGREENGEDAEEDVCVAHGGGCAVDRVGKGDAKCALLGKRFFDDEVVGLKRRKKGRR